MCKITWLLIGQFIFTLWVRWSLFVLNDSDWSVMVIWPKQMTNISSLDFCIWQHLEKHQNESQLQHLASIPSVPVGQLYSHMALGIQHITLFSPEESTGDTDSIWTLFSHTGVYVTAIGSLIPVGLGIFCSYFFLMSTCQICMQTFTARYHAIYNCRWWCRGSTHLQMCWQGLTAYKISWESWPAYRAYTYIDGELM